MAVDAAPSTGVQDFGGDATDQVKLRVREVLEAVAAVQVVRVRGRQHLPAQTRQIRVFQQGFNNKSAKSATPVLPQDEHVGDPRERGSIRHRSGHSDLAAVGCIEPNDERVSNRALDDVAGYAGRPVDLTQESVYHIELKSLDVVVDLEPVLALLLHPLIISISGQ